VLAFHRHHVGVSGQDNPSLHFRTGAREEVGLGLIRVVEPAGVKAVF
jgi:hypothetical protein